MGLAQIQDPWFAGMLSNWGPPKLLNPPPNTTEVTDVRITYHVPGGVLDWLRAHKMAVMVTAAALLLLVLLRRRRR